MSSDSPAGAAHPADSGHGDFAHAGHPGTGRPSTTPADADRTGTDRTYTVIGGGAIGGTLAFALPRAGHPVRLIDADPVHVAAIRPDGLVRDNDSDTGRAAVPVLAATPEEYEWPALGRILLAVKAQATEAAMGWIAPRVALAREREQAT